MLKFSLYFQVGLISAMNENVFNTLFFITYYVILNEVKIFCKDYEYFQKSISVWLVTSAQSKNKSVWNLLFKFQ